MDSEQKGIVRGSALALLSAMAAGAAAYAFIPASVLGLDNEMTSGDRIAFAAKAAFPMFIWLAACVRTVSSYRFRSPADRKGSAFAAPSAGLAVRSAVLQNSLEQTVLALGAQLVLAATLRGAELVLLPAFTVIFLIGRAAFAISYAKGAAARSFGMALTAAPIIFAYLAAFGLIVAGR